MTFEGKAMENFYKIIDHFGREIGLNTDGTLAPKKDNKDCSDVFLFISSRNQNIGYIIPESKRKVFCADDPFGECVYSLNVFYANVNQVAFTDVSNGFFLTSVDWGWLTFEARNMQEWELFTLRKIEYSCIAEKKYVVEVVHSIENFLENYSCFSELSSEQEKKSIILGFFAHIRHIKLEELEQICSHISRDTEWVNIICDQDQSIWSSFGLKPLTTWLNNRNTKPTSYIVGKDFDFLSDEIVPFDGYGTRSASATETIVRTIRALVKPTHDFCVLATARNEGIYLAEWVSYYKSIGFDGIYLYINDCEDNSRGILSSLEQEDYLEFFETVSKDGVNVQGKAYAHALSFLPQILNYRWVLIVDLDELFVYDKKQFKDLKSYFEFLEKKQVDTVAFDWINIGSNKQITWSEEPYFDRFSNKGFLEHEKLKTIFRPAKAAKSYPHFPVEFDNYSFIRRNSVGNLLKTRQNEEKHGPLGKHLNDAPDSRFAVIYHYYFKSIEEFIWKSARNRGDHPKNTDFLNTSFNEILVTWFLEHFEAENTVTSDSLSFPDISFLRDHFYEEYEKMLSIPTVKYEISINVDIFKNKLDTLLQKISQRKEFLGENQIKMLSMLEK
ncbi:glycosyltransferase family 2 protein [Acetobacter oryzoeni]|uniref:Glycosyltransferase family 2 protein n=1 Tax=Acetobacter oryzoeni TaxID=2500548 RepID=A0A5B9GLX0_9PROT|nr:glycosyltransferase family 2 protein [Acetobacter oryzoeni]MCP1202019.1 glycosyltransferase family 2 protein [Acetobacter oryzoeni]QEE85736.1 glycosyltransferase family 2 protein [Acetobacter oryzoeni]